MTSAELDRKHGKYFLAEIDCSTRVWIQWPAVAILAAHTPTRLHLGPHVPAPMRVDHLGLSLALDRWQPLIVQEVTKGLLAAKITSDVWSLGTSNFLRVKSG